MRQNARRSHKNYEKAQNVSTFNREKISVAKSQEKRLPHYIIHSYTLLEHILIQEVNNKKAYVVPENRDMA